MRFNYGYQDMASDVIAKNNNYILEKVTNLKEGCCILICKATNATISSYTSYEKGLKDMAMKEYRDTLLDIKEYVYINAKIREY